MPLTGNAKFMCTPAIKNQTPHTLKNHIEHEKEQYLIFPSPPFKNITVQDQNKLISKGQFIYTVFTIHVEEIEQIDTQMDNKNRRSLALILPC